MSYIDTSILVAYYHAEPATHEVCRRLAKVESPTISALVELEVYAALAIKHRLGELSTEEAAAIADKLTLHLREGWYRLVTISDDVFIMARQWVLRFDTGLRAPDALHLAAAYSHGLRLLTSDVVLADAAKRLRVKHELVRV